MTESKTQFKKVWVQYLYNSWRQTKTSVERDIAHKMIRVVGRDFGWSSKMEL